MNCPRCLKDELLETTRENVVIDTCPKCRGIWLDRGELERLMATIERIYDHGPPSSERGHGQAGHGPHKKSGFRSLLDIFD